VALGRGGAGAFGFGLGDDADMTIERIKELIVTERRGLDISEPSEMRDVVLALAQTELGSGLADLSADILAYAELPSYIQTEPPMKRMLDLIAGTFRLGYVVGKAYERDSPEATQ
jgi:hypothetical protein